MIVQKGKKEKNECSSLIFLLYASDALLKEPQNVSGQFFLRTRLFVVQHLQAVLPRAQASLGWFCAQAVLFVLPISALDIIFQTTPGSRKGIL